MGSKDANTANSRLIVPQPQRDAYVFNEKYGKGKRKWGKGKREKGKGKRKKVSL